MSSSLAALSLSGQDAMQTLSSLCKGAAADAPVPLFSAAASGVLAWREDSHIRATFQASLTVRMRLIHSASRSANFLLSTTRSMRNKSRKQHTASLPRGSAHLCDMATQLTLLICAGAGPAVGETAPSGVLKSPAVISGSEKHGSEHAKSLVAAHPIDQSKVIGCNTHACKFPPHTAADILFCMSVCQHRPSPLQCSETCLHI